MRFGENLRRIRKRNHLSQEELAEKVNVSRQSVSKWETGDAYPEMNNILELCKQFKCRINDLVNDAILDLDSLDEEVKMNVVKLKKEQQKKMKGISKTIYIIARIMKTLVIITIPIIIFSMIASAVIVNKTTLINDEIKFTGFKQSITIKENDNNYTLMIKDKTIRDIPNQRDLSFIKDIMKKNSKLVLLIGIEVMFLTVLVIVILFYLTLRHLEGLFTNIYDGNTPFTLENIDHIKYMAYFMIAVIILPNILGPLTEIIFKLDLDIGFELFDLIQILFLFSMAYIFQYGYEIQLDSQGIMYGDKYE